LKWIAIVAKPGILVCALAVTTAKLDAPLRGDFYFRQAHVAANIEQFIANGLSIVPATYNLDVPYAVFDFPLYQLLVATICVVLESDPLFTARIVNVAVFVLTALLVNSLLARAEIPRAHRLMTLFLFCFSPMTLFYSQAPFVDPLAISLSLLSLFAFLGLNGTRGVHRALQFTLLVTAGTLSTLIKSPVYLPVFVAVVAHTFWRRFELLRRLESLIYVVVIGSTVLVFKSWSNRVNGVTGFFDTNEPREYFGPLADRLDPESWHRIGGILLHDAANSVTLTLAAVGVAIWALRSRRRARTLFLALLGGWMLTLLVFFNRFTWHNYYLLGFEFPLAFFGAYALDQTRVLGRTWRRRERAPLGFPASVAFAAVAGFTLAASTAAAREMAETPTEWIQKSGEFIRRSTAPEDFVVYVVESRDFQDWNPVFLYFAQRRGYNLTTRRLERRPAVLLRLRARYGPSSRRFVVFCPSSATRLAPLLESLGAWLLEAGPSGWLYRLSADGDRPPTSPPKPPDRDHRPRPFHASRALVGDVERVQPVEEPRSSPFAEGLESREKSGRLQTSPEALVDARKPREPGMLMRHEVFEPFALAVTDGAEPEAHFANRVARWNRRRAVSSRDENGRSREEVLSDPREGERARVFLPQNAIECNGVEERRECGCESQSELQRPSTRKAFDEESCRKTQGRRQRQGIAREACRRECRDGVERREPKPEEPPFPAAGMDRESHSSERQERNTQPIEKREPQRIERVGRRETAIAPGFAKELRDAAARALGIEQDERRGDGEGAREESRDRDEIPGSFPTGRTQEEDRNESEGPRVLGGGCQTREERPDAQQGAALLEPTLRRGGDAGRREEHERNVGRREVRLADVLIRHCKEEGREETGLGREKTPSQNAEQQHGSDATGDRDQAADEARGDRVPRHAKKGGVDVHQEAGVVEEARVGIGGLQHPLRRSRHELFVRPHALDVEAEVEGPQAERGREEQHGSPSKELSERERRLSARFRHFS
jgi:hypothetical protein